MSDQPGKGIQQASLSYRLLDRKQNFGKLEIRLHTGRTHQIRVQFASRGFPLVGERKYSCLDDPCEIALYSQEIGFRHPVTGVWMQFHHEPPEIYPWSLFDQEK